MARRLGVFSLLLGLAVGPTEPAAQTAGTSPSSSALVGRIEGTARLARRLTTRRLRVRVYAEPGVMPPSIEPDTNPLASVVLYLDSPSSVVARGGATGPLAIRQRGERFRPHVLAVTTGSVVAFPNDDPIYHNVFSLSSARTFDLGRYPAGDTKSVDFPRPGVVQIFCHIHADMSAYVLVFDHPYFVVPDAQGRFAIEDVPPGEYRLVAWHERVNPAPIPVRVEAGRTAVVDVSIPIPEEP
jgi:plastocyanin